MIARDPVFLTAVGTVAAAIVLLTAGTVILNGIMR